MSGSKTKVSELDRDKGGKIGSFQAAAVQAWRCGARRSWLAENSVVLLQDKHDNSLPAF